MNPQTTELIEQYRDINTDHDWWDGVYDCFTADMDTIGVTVEQMYFRGFWSQGDGACFEGYVHDWAKFLPSVDPAYDNLVLIEHSKFFEFSCQHSGFYYHEHSVQYDVVLPLPESADDMDFADRYCPYPLDDLRTLAWLAVLNRYSSTTLENHLRDAFTGHMQTLYADLETEYDYLTSDEAVWEAIVANNLNEEEHTDE